MNNPNATLFAGEVLDGRDPDHPMPSLVDGSRVIVRVREVRARHHLEILQLFYEGKEGDLLQRCVERGTPGEAGAVTFAPVDVAFVDSLSDESHATLVEFCDKLNFKRAIATAERQIARGQNLGPLMEKLTSVLLAPLRKELGSWTSSLTSQLSAAMAAKQP